MSLLLRAAGLAGIYLLVLTSVHPADVAAGLLLGLGVALLVRPREEVRGAGTSLTAGATLALLARTAVEMAAGTWRTVRFCLGAPYRPGFVEVPWGARTRRDVALWGVLTGEAPDEVVAGADEERGVLVVHLIDASDPEAVRERHARSAGAG